jgi:hypothetical protein
MFWACTFPSTTFSYPEGIKKVHDNFYGCNIVNLILPSSIEDVSGMFDGFRRDRNQLYNLANIDGMIVCKATTPPTYNGTINLNTAIRP